MNFRRILFLFCIVNLLCHSVFGELPEKRNDPQQKSEIEKILREVPPGFSMSYHSKEGYLFVNISRQSVALGRFPGELIATDLPAILTIEDMACLQALEKYDLEIEVQIKAFQIDPEVISILSGMTNIRGLFFADTWITESQLLELSCLDLESITCSVKTLSSETLSRFRQVRSLDLTVETIKDDLQISDFPNLIELYIGESVERQNSVVITVSDNPKLDAIEIEGLEQSSFIFENMLRLYSITNRTFSNFRSNDLPEPEFPEFSKLPRCLFNCQWSFRNVSLATVSFEPFEEEEWAEYHSISAIKKLFEKSPRIILGRSIDLSIPENQMLTENDIRTFTWEDVLKWNRPSKLK